MSAAPMTTEGKRALARTIRQLRAQLLEDLRDATERAYRLSLPVKRARLGHAANARRARFVGWIEDSVRHLPEKQRAAARERARTDIEKDAAALLVQRLVYLRLLEAAGLQPVPVLTGGWQSRGYLDFREFASALCTDPSDPSEGYATLLSLLYAELALDLPGLFGEVRLTALVPIPASSLRLVVEALDQPELASVWTDDTTLGWVYQYWNDPEREALDVKLNARQKLARHEIASKTQMFTERYLVEWLLHNSLGPMWLAMCRQHGWTADAEAPGADGGPSVLDDLDARRAAWRARREAGEVALDALMPIAEGLEDRWKYYVPQPIPDDAVTQAPASVRDIRLLDPACGSGHFLVIAFSLLFALYREEARHRGQVGQPAWTDEAIARAILERNLHGIDIDPRAVQIAAAALVLEAKKMAPDLVPEQLHLVAPDLGLARLPADDPARQALYRAVEADTGLPADLLDRVLDALSDADHLGTLLRVDDAVANALSTWDKKLSSAAHVQGHLFRGHGHQQTQLFDAAEMKPGFGPEKRTDVTPETAQKRLLDRLERFLAAHSSSDDLGLRLRGRQLAAGVRFVRLVREGQYDLVVGNPPYQGTSKMADASYITKHYQRGKADLYAAFLERGLQLAREGGVSALLTMRNWMFIKQYTKLREWLLQNYDLRALGDFDRGAFEDIPDEIVAVVVSVFRHTAPSVMPSVVIQPTPLDDKQRDLARTARKRAALQCMNSKHIFRPTDLVSIENRPIVYWWSDENFKLFNKTIFIKNVSPAKQGLITGNNTRFLRRPWEVHPEATGWAPYIKGADGRTWFEPVSEMVLWRFAGLQIHSFSQDGRQASRPQNPGCYFQPGVAFTMIGRAFSARLHRVPSIFGGALPGSAWVDETEAPG